MANGNFKNVSSPAAQPSRFTTLQKLAFMLQDVIPNVVAMTEEKRRNYDSAVTTVLGVVDKDEREMKFGSLLIRVFLEKEFFPTESAVFGNVNSLSDRDFTCKFRLGVAYLIQFAKKHSEEFPEIPNPWKDVLGGSVQSKSLY